MAGCARGKPNARAYLTVSNTMSNSESLIENREMLTVLFGGWPSFHDAEVIELNCWRGSIKPGDWDDSNIFPILAVKLRILQAAQNAYSAGSPDVLATLRFYDVDQLKIDDFNHVNQIFDFTVVSQERGSFLNGEKLPPYLVVSFDRGFGISAEFRCFRIEVSDVVAFEDETAI